jgi:hypothetical protein
MIAAQLVPEITFAQAQQGLEVLERLLRLTDLESFDPPDAFGVNEDGSLEIRFDGDAAHRFRAEGILGQALLEPAGWKDVGAFGGARNPLPLRGDGREHV